MSDSDSRARDHGAEAAVAAAVASVVASSVVSATSGQGHVTPSVAIKLPENEKRQTQPSEEAIQKPCTQASNNKMM